MNIPGSGPGCGYVGVELTEWIVPVAWINTHVSSNPIDARFERRRFGGGSPPKPRRHFLLVATLLGDQVLDEKELIGERIVLAEVLRDLQV